MHRLVPRLGLVVLLVVVAGAADGPGERTREIIAGKRYLNLPVKTGAPNQRVAVLVDGKVHREFEIELADEKPDFWAFLDLADVQGKRLTLRAKSAALDLVEQGDALKGEKLYQEKLRPQFHFTSRRGWLNDPNGLVFFQGEYHLFYQHNPYGWNWGNMHWGHAVSKDLVRWHELPIALYPKKFGDWAFSGSAWVDRQNAGGFQKGGEPALVGAFTSTGRGECIVFSDDKGRTWAEYPGNPVVKHVGRDPKVFWHAPTKQWVMAVYGEEEKKQHIAFHTSTDLKSWQYQSSINGFYECPDLIELPVDGDRSKAKWVLYGADAKYMIGSFDGKTFTPEGGKQQLWHGNFYAAQTYSDMPDGRCVQVGWGQGITFPGMPFNQQMAFPCELSLRTTDDGVRLFAQPVREIDTLHDCTFRWRDLTIKPGEDPLGDTTGEFFDIRANITLGDAEQVNLTVRGVAVIYDAKKQELSCKGKTVALKPVAGTLRLQVLVDRGSLEIFGNDGRVAVSLAALLPPENESLSLSVKGGTAKVNLLEVFRLKSAWE